MISNLLSALAGGGAGLIQLPALLLLGINFTSALSTHKVASVALGIGATLRYSKSKPINTENIESMSLAKEFVNSTKEETKNE